jgi:hypothetical protein
MKKIFKSTLMGSFAFINRWHEIPLKNAMPAYQIPYGFLPPPERSLSRPRTSVASWKDLKLAGIRRIWDSLS